MSQIANLGLQLYTPEMGERKPIAQIEAIMGRGNHWSLRTPLMLKGRGITLREVLTKDKLLKSGWYMDGWFSYWVTDRAFDKLKEQYSISCEMLLD